MSYASILVYLDDPLTAKDTLAVACQMAETHRAHLTAVYVVPMLGQYTAFDFPIPEDAREGYLDLHRQRAAQIEVLFNRETGNHSFESEWRFIDSCAQPAEEALTAMANAFDLLVMRHNGEDHAATLHRDFSSKVLLSCVRPVLLVPSTSSGSGAFSRVLVAYDFGARSSRAILDALPILKLASSVVLQRINAPDCEQEFILDQAVEILSTLARHGVKAEMVYSTASHGLLHRGTIGQELVDIAADTSADILIMGAYSHRRLGQQILGGTTRTVLGKMHLPVVMSH